MKTVVLKLFVFFILPISLTHCTPKEKEVFYDRKYKDEVKQARKEVVYYMVSNSVPGATFAVSKEGKLLYSDALGLASKDLNVPVTRNTKFRIGKLTENFTALLYHQLAEEGIIHPDSSVQHYLPKLNLSISFSDFIKSQKEGQLFIAHCEETDKKELSKEVKPTGNITVLIGPEGDFSEKEIKTALSVGYTPVSLGNTRLRTETAAIYASAVVSVKQSENY